MIDAFGYQPNFAERGRAEEVHTSDIFDILQEIIGQLEAIPDFKELVCPQYRVDLWKSHNSLAAFAGYFFREYTSFITGVLSTHDHLPVITHRTQVLSDIARMLPQLSDPQQHQDLAAVFQTEFYGDGQAVRVVEACWAKLHILLGLQDPRWDFR